MKLIQTIHACDVFMFNWVMNRKHLDLCARASRWISRSGDGFFYPVIGIGLYLSEPVFGRLFFLSALAAFLIERPLYFLLKNGFKRGRPAQALPGVHSFIIPSDQFSFPSGHTSAAFVMATLLSYYYPPLLWPLYAWASAVGVSRIFLGVHFPTDVLVGLTMGTSIALASIRIFAA